MTTRTLAAAVLTFFSAAVCSFAAADDGLLALVPGDSEFVVGINVVSSRNSELGQYLSAHLGDRATGLEQLTAETGFDPKRDLQSVVYAGVSSPAGTQHPAVIVLVRGTFDQDKIRSAALAKGAVVRSSSGVDVYVQGTGRHRNGFAFVQNDVFAMGSEAGLQKVVANLSTPTQVSVQLQKLIAQAGTGNDIWFASAVSASRLPMPVAPDSDDLGGGSQMLQTISAATGGVRLGSSVQITVDAIAQSEKDASSLADVVRFGASLIQSRGQSDPNTALLASAVNQMLVSANGQNVHLSLSMPESALEQLAEARRSARHVAH